VRRRPLHFPLRPNTRPPRVPALATTRFFRLSSSPFQLIILVHTFPWVESLISHLSPFISPSLSLSLMARGKSGKAGKPQTRYVSGQTTHAPQPRPRPRQPLDSDSHSGEDFDFESADRQKSSSESTASPLVSSSASLPPTVASDVPTRATTPSSELLGPPPKKSGRHTAKDIEYYFRKVLGTQTVCKVCEYVIPFPRGEKFLTRCRMTRKRSEESPGSVDVSFRFSSTTSNTTLRKHLDTPQHIDEYLRLHKARGWTSQLDSMKKAAGTVPTPVSEAQSLAPFSQKSFLDHLRDFIIADDQVGTLRCLPLPY
jgi:hypothetical protein